MWNPTGQNAGASNAAFESFLLLHHADPNTRNAVGKSPLMVDVEAPDTPLATLLLAHGADPNLTDNSGQTILHILAQQKAGQHSGLDLVPI